MVIDLVKLGPVHGMLDRGLHTRIAPRELPVGAITALIGAPLFIYLLKRGSGYARVARASKRK